MLVVHLINGLGVGGGEQLLADLVRQLDERDFHSVIYCLTRGGPVRDLLAKNGVRVHRLTERGIPKGSSWMQLFRDLRRAQVIHTHFFYSDLFGSVLGRVFRVPRRISTRHDTGYWMRPLHLALEPWVYSGFHQVLCVSQAVAESMRQRGVPGDRLVSLPPGVVGSPDLEAPRPDEGPRVVAVGRLERVKGHDLLLRAYAKFVAQREFAHWRLTIVGGGSQQQRLERLACELGIDGACEFTGELERQNVWDLLASASLFVLSSYSEAMPLSLIEAMKCGVPCIATAVGGVTELISHGENGWLVDAGDCGQLTHALISLAGDTCRARALGETAKRSVLGKYDLEQYVRGVVESYRER
ncbi:MAG: hypothetical protein A2289_08875 [Deltaproteobacteria bacterium RIFOXYA12_FULL_58_15]|nr:MAG: hypothetical protein A2289_08875 [Deltaproteobacteria bacterium RIFOXYA12_FULL_58_15]OGR10555.1 MAG: hypothetical protein A2341_09715 [Deltaproteobacteria bacterium RIFOXYB12_FULL_58_9]